MLAHVHKCWDTRRTQASRGVGPWRLSPVANPSYVKWLQWLRTVAGEGIGPLAFGPVGALQRGLGGSGL
jgi:hypothetical protein